MAWQVPGPVIGGDDPHLRVRQGFQRAGEAPLLRFQGAHGGSVQLHPERTRMIEAVTRDAQPGSGHNPGGRNCGNRGRVHLPRETRIPHRAQTGAVGVIEPRFRPRTHDQQGGATVPARCDDGPAGLSLHLSLIRAVAEGDGMSPSQSRGIRHGERDLRGFRSAIAAGQKASARGQWREVAALGVRKEVHVVGSARRDAVRPEHLTPAGESLEQRGEQFLQVRRTFVGCLLRDRKPMGNHLRHQGNLQPLLAVRLEGGQILGRIRLGSLPGRRRAKRDQVALGQVIGFMARAVHIAQHFHLPKLVHQHPLPGGVAEPADLLDRLGDRHCQIFHRPVAHHAQAVVMPVIQGAGPVQAVNDKALEVGQALEVTAHLLVQERPQGVTSAGIHRHGPLPGRNGVALRVLDQRVGKALPQEAVRLGGIAAPAAASAVFRHVKIGEGANMVREDLLSLDLLRLQPHW